MKYLFIVQGEGRGHLTRCIALEEILRNNGHEVVEILVGKSNARSLPEFFGRSVHAPVGRFESPNFLPTASNKRDNIMRSVAYNLAKVPTFWRSIRYIRQRIRETEADVVINFYELLTGFAYAFYPITVPQICIGHQYLFLHRDFDLPRRLKAKILMLNFFSRLTSFGAYKRLALSFKQLDEDKKQHICVVPPLLRKEVFRQQTTPGDYIHGYMLNSGFSADVMKWHAAHPDVELRFFWDKWSEGPVKKVDDTLSFYTIDDKEFLRQMAGCYAYASTAGFESICEAMYLGKPVLMVPSHVEQECNAFDATRCGVGIAARNFDLSALLEFAERFEPDAEFPSWAAAAEEIIIREIESCI